MKFDEKMLDNRLDDNATINTDVLSLRVSPQHPHFSTSNPFKTNLDGIYDKHHESTSPQDTEYDFTVDFLNGIKPFAIRLQGNIMPTSSTLPTPPPLPSPRTAPLSEATQRTRVPSFATRRAACTHLTVERLYGHVTCNVCSRFPVFGWVYCCTQDEVPESQLTPDSTSEVSSPPHQHVNGSEDEPNGVNHLSMPSPAVNEDFGFGGEDILVPTVQLSPWIEKAIEDGHYTPEQVVKLRAQKQHVADTARAAIHQFEQSQTNDTNISPQTPTTLQSVDANPHLPFPIINEIQPPSGTRLPTAREALAWQAKPRLFPFCKFCACQLCRPTHRDRAWQRFDDIFESEHEIPFVHYEDRNRPLASRSIMSTIGLRPPPVPQRPPLRSTDSRALYSRNEAGQFFFNNNNGSYRKSADSTGSSVDIADMNFEAESKGFRVSMRRALKNMLMARRASSRSERKRRAREGTDTTEEDAVEFDMGLWKELNDELLKEASGVPLPEKDSIEGLSKEVAGMGGVGGVAVTEEAADLGTADVIMSI